MLHILRLNKEKEYTPRELSVRVLQKFEIQTFKKLDRYNQPITTEYKIHNFKPTPISHVNFFLRGSRDRDVYPSFSQTCVLTTSDEYSSEEKFRQS